MKKLFFTVLSIAVLVTSLLAFSSCKKEKTANVVFMSNGKMFASVATAGNAIVPMPPEPTKAGYVFGGWFYDENLWDQPYDNTAWETIPLLGDVTVYAKWKPSVPCEEHTPRDFTVLEEPSCSKEGTKRTVCRVCDETYTESIPTLAHTPLAAVVENEHAASCDTASSYDEVVYCSVCSGEVSRTTVTGDKLSHIPAEEFTVANFVDSTCAKEGSYDEVYKCTVCTQTALTVTKTVEKKPHTPALEAVKENEIASSCIEKGSYEMVTRCTECDEKISSTTHELPLENHTATIPCAVCGMTDYLVYEYVEDEDCYFVSGATVTNVTEITIPAKYNGKSVKGIAEGAFKDFTQLKKITVPTSVMKIEKNAFLGCSSLTDVGYKGTKKEWGYITIVAQGNDPLLQASKDYESNRTEWMPF